MKIYLGSDHAGFKLKEEVRIFLEQQKIKVVDLGNIRLQQGDDYPKYAYEVAKRVARERETKGILFCGNAQGVCIVANKIDGIRAAVGYSGFGAKTSREDDESNILCLAGRVLTPAQAKNIVQIWLATPFSGEIRHQRRIKQIREIEDHDFRPIEIIPSILVKSAEEFRSKLGKIEHFFPLAQIDVADGTLTSHSTYADWREIRLLNTEISYDLHLMIDDPIAYLKRINNFRKIFRVFFQLESKAKPLTVINYIKRHKALPCVAINPQTPVSSLKPWLKYLSAVLVLGVKPGENGGAFLPGTIERVKQIRNIYKKGVIIVDGGVKPKNAPQLIAAGADALVVGSYLNRHQDWSKALTLFRL